MPRESFQHRETETLFRQLENVSQRSGVSRGQAFEDFLHVSVCALGRPLMEHEYLQTIERHTAGDVGRRGCDLLAEMFGTVVATMQETRADVLGDLFQGAISYGERGQFLTPEPVCDLLATMNVPKQDTGLEGRRTVNDPACGSGRMLSAVGKLQPHWHFIGCDVDLRCVRLTVLNLALRNLYGHVIQGNTLTLTTELIYETGRVQMYGNAVRIVNHVPVPNVEPQRINKPGASTTPCRGPSKNPSVDPQTDGSQLELF